MKNILVTGGAGYIGSHTLIELVKAGFNPVVYDNLSNSSSIALHRVEQIVNQKISFIKGDVLDKDLLKQVFNDNDFFAVIHFAGLKAVGESVAKPIKYYQNNVAGTLNLLEVMNEFKVKNFVFSSSATVYGDPETLPIIESAKRSCTNPYGQSKLTVEYILEDLCKSSEFNAISLRYFNPIGAYETGTIGEDPSDIPNNLMPYISQVAVGKLEKLSVFGNDYDTVDGTGVRDYIHVVDLAKGHLKALEYLVNCDNENKVIGFEPINLGTGNGTSVLELVNAFIKNTGQTVPYVIAPRRAGDIASCYASCDKAKQVLNWTAEFDIERACVDTWRWQSNNPKGYQ
ncbi:MAG: UDP-glucose 4-epimerase GalE [Moraxella sp.]|nr:UDP-glucose 4-epimerase GalE [Moraxella sp.]